MSRITPLNVIIIINIIIIIPISSVLYMVSAPALEIVRGWAPIDSFVF